MPELQRTLLLVKPDGVERGLIGEILSRFERRGFKIVGLKLLRVSEALAHEHYRDHVGKPFFPSLVEFITRGPIVAFAVEGADAVALARKMMGALNPLDTPSGTIRGDFASSRQMNLIHGSDSPESAARELSLFFAPDELHDYTRSLDQWIVAEE